MRASVAIGNMGVTYEEQGDYGRAFDCYQQQFEAASEAGDQRNISIAVGNMGLLYGKQGGFTQALQCYSRQLQIALELGDRRVISWALSDIADNYMVHDQYGKAEQLLTKAITLGRTLNILYDLCDYLHQMASLYTRQQQYTRAQALNAEALELAKQSERSETEFKALILSNRLRIALRQIEPPSAIDELRKLLDMWPEPEQQAGLHHEIWKLDRAQAHHQQTAASLYRNLYAVTPNMKYALCYEDLTGEKLETPSTLPKLSATISEKSIDLQPLLARVDTLITVPDDDLG